MTLYYFFHVLGFGLLCLYIFRAGKYFGVPRGKALLLCTASYLSMYGWMLLLKLWVTGSGGQNAIRAYLFLPLFVCLYGTALGLDIHKAMDLTAIAPCLVQGISHIGCIFPGCCYSWWKVEWGIYNSMVGARLFPVQLAESATALLIAGGLFLDMKKKNYRTDGLYMPGMMIWFGLTRFGWEFLRDNEKIVFGISELAFWALGMALVGAVWLCIARYRTKQ